jgi:hypothetical protein
MRLLWTKSILVLLLVNSLALAGQTRRFTRDDIEYVVELPSPAWQVVSRADVHHHPEFINGNDPSNGYLGLRKILVDQPKSASELFRRDEKWELQHLPGYIVCSECEGTTFEGHLSGAFFSYEYVNGGRAMFGRVYYLQLNERTFYSLRFTVARDKLRDVREQMDLIARSFRLK